MAVRNNMNKPSLGVNVIVTIIQVISFIWLLFFCPIINVIWAIWMFIKLVRKNGGK